MILRCRECGEEWWESPRPADPRCPCCGSSRIRTDEDEEEEPEPEADDAGPV